MGWILQFSLRMTSALAMVADAIDEARKDDGRISPDEAEAIARKLSAEGDWIRINVQGTDVAGPEAQALLFAGLARICARASNARA